MKKESEIHLLCLRYRVLEGLSSAIDKVARVIIDCYRHNGELLICGNGGSSSDA